MLVLVLVLVLVLARPEPAIKEFAGPPAILSRSIKIPVTQENTRWSICQPSIAGAFSSGAAVVVPTLLAVAS